MVVERVVRDHAQPRAEHTWLVDALGTEIVHLEGVWMEFAEEALYFLSGVAVRALEAGAWEAHGNDCGPERPGGAGVRSHAGAGGRQP